MPSSYFSRQESFLYTFYSLRSLFRFSSVQFVIRDYKRISQFHGDCRVRKYLEVLRFIPEALCSSPLPQHKFQFFIHGTGPRNLRHCPGPFRHPFIHSSVHASIHILSDSFVRNRSVCSFLGLFFIYANQGAEVKS